MDNKCYKFGDDYYTFEELYKMCKYSDDMKRKNIKDCICHFILAQIMKKGGLDKYGDSVDAIAMIEAKRIKTKSSKVENIKYSLLILRLQLLCGMKKRYKVNEFFNGEWLLNKLVGLTLGSNYAKNEIDDFSLIDLDDINEKACALISKNFINNMKDKKIEQYKYNKRLEKRINKS